MIRKGIFIIFVVFELSLVIGQSLTIPVAGVVGQDYIIVNYPDWHLNDGTVLVPDGVLNDHHCGSKTYDGHQGTDFVISGFPQMDSGVDVLASADGLITYFIDSLFDRETGGVIALSLGNYIEIYHASTNTYSYYAHLKKNSVTVQVGDVVSAGQVIAQIGSSGNSTDPHLHYELWNVGLITDPTIDPWGIPCDSGSNMWQNPPAYDTSFAVWECGLVNYDSVENFNPITWYPLRERMGLKDTFTVNDPFFTFWALQYGLKVGDETTVEWYEPNGSLYSSETVNYLVQDWWYHYFNSSIPTPSASKGGLWTVRYYYNNVLVINKSFLFEVPASTKAFQDDQLPYYYQVGPNSIVVVSEKVKSFSTLKVYSSSGELVLQKELNELSDHLVTLPNDQATGLYIVVLEGVDDYQTFKAIFQ